jgi:hypothetical protein
VSHDSGACRSVEWDSLTVSVTKGSRDRRTKPKITKVIVVVAIFSITLRVCTSGG